MVFSREAYAFQLLTLPFRLFVGGPLGDGRQWFTWIHIDDIVGIYRLPLEDARVARPANPAPPPINPQPPVPPQLHPLLPPNAPLRGRGPPPAVAFAPRRSCCRRRGRR